jgi:rubrerythrin
MNKISLSLNFMHCMERFATQIYRTQLPSFKESGYSRQLTDASANERTHVDKLKMRIIALNYHVYPLGFLFQSAGVVLGIITRASGKRNLFKADTFVENRAVKDYNGFLKAVAFDADTMGMIRGIIAEEEVHIANWKKAIEMIKKSAGAAV